MVVIVLVGMPGSGKEEFVRVAREIGYRVTRMGDVVREEAERRGIGGADMEIGPFATSERREHGLDIWARRTIPRIGGDTIIDGSRGDAEIRAFQEAFGGEMVTVYIDADPRIRYERLRARGREDAPASYEQFLERERREISWGIDRAIDLAGERIENNGTLEEFRAASREFLESLSAKI